VCAMSCNTMVCMNMFLLLVRLFQEHCVWGGWVGGWVGAKSCNTMVRMNIFYWCGYFRNNARAMSCNTMVRMNAFMLLVRQLQEQRGVASLKCEL